MEVSKFKIGSDIIDIKDAQARDDVVAAMNASQDAQSTADDALEGLAAKQDSLNHPSYTGDIDTLYNNPEYNGYYFVNGSSASGTQPATGYYMLLVFGGLQFAVTANATTVYFYARTYVNGAWSYWRKVQLTT